MQKSSPIEIAYRDEYLVVANKPSGLLSIPTPKKESRTLTSLLNAQLKDESGPGKLHPCHRLDRDTSGLVIYGRGRKAYRAMTEQFRQRRVGKKYLAFVSGRLKDRQGTIKKPVRESAYGRRNLLKTAVTRYRVREEREGYSVVEVVPLTGRTNQIRIHFAAEGHPLLGERQYAFGRDFVVKFNRLALHACELEFFHPFSGKKLSLSCPLPQDMARFLKEH